MHNPFFFVCCILAWLSGAVASSHFDGCFRSPEAKKQAESCTRLFLLLITLSSIAAFGVILSKQSISGNPVNRNYYDNLFKEFVACLSVYVISVVPEICHQSHKYQIYTGLSLFFILFPLGLVKVVELGQDTQEILTAIQMGGFFSCATWFTILLVCTDANRIKCTDCVRAFPSVGPFLSRWICCSSSEVGINYTKKYEDINASQFSVVWVFYDFISFEKVYISRAFSVATFYVLL